MYHMFSKRWIHIYGFFLHFIIIMLKTNIAFIMPPKIFEDEAPEAKVTLTLYTDLESNILS